MKWEVVKQADPNLQDKEETVCVCKTYEFALTIANSLNETGTNTYKVVEKQTGKSK